MLPYPSWCTPPRTPHPGRGTPPSAGIGFRGLAPRGEEVEVAALIGLGDVRRVQRAVPARVPGRWRGPCGAAPGQLRRGYLQFEPALLDVEADGVAVAHQRQRPTHMRLGSDVQDAGAIAGTGHPRVGDPDHVPDAAFEQPVR